MKGGTRARFTFLVFRLAYRVGVGHGIASRSWIRSRPPVYAPSVKCSMRLALRNVRIVPIITM